MAVVGITDWADVGGGTALLAGRPAGRRDREHRQLRPESTDDVVGGILTVTFDYPLDLVIPFMPNPPSWQTGTAKATMRIEQLSVPGGPGGC
jgi:hypothetical protein